MSRSESYPKYVMSGYDSGWKVLLACLWLAYLCFGPDPYSHQGWPAPGSYRIGIGTFVLGFCGIFTLVVWLVGAKIYFDNFQAKPSTGSRILLAFRTYLFISVWCVISLSQVGFFFCRFDFFPFQPGEIRQLQFMHRLALESYLWPLTNMFSDLVSVELIDEVRNPALKAYIVSCRTVSTFIMLFVAIVPIIYGAEAKRS